MKYRIDNLSVPKKNPFANDDLERQPLVNFLSDLIKRLNGPFVLALDSPFGMGKTTLVHMLMENLMCEGHQCTYFNAWEVDFATDPLVALISSIDRIGLNSSEGETEFVQQFQKVKDLTTVLAKPSIIAATKLLTSGAIDLEEIITAISSASKVDGKGEAVEEFNQEFELLDKFRDELKIAIELLPTTNNTISLVIFVDELDRCRPTFAIHLLERIKHLFDIPTFCSFCQ